MKKSYQSIMFFAAIAALAIIGTGCGPSFAGDSYSRGEARSGQRVRFAVITEIAWVEIEGTSGTAGAIGGGLLGGIAGHSIGGGHGKALATVAGAGAGALAGSAIESAVTKKKALEIMVEFENGKSEVIVQEPGKDQFYVGQQVRVVGNGETARVRP